MDGPTISVEASGKEHRTFRVVALCVCIAAVTFGIIDFSGGHHRIVATCTSAGFACYFANGLRSNRWWLIVAVVLWLAAISAFFAGI